MENKQKILFILQILLLCFFIIFSFYYGIRFIRGSIFISQIININEGHLNTIGFIYIEALIISLIFFRFFYVRKNCFFKVVFAFRRMLIIAELLLAIYCVTNILLFVTNTQIQFLCIGENTISCIQSNNNTDNYDNIEINDDEIFADSDVIDDINYEEFFGENFISNYQRSTTCMSYNSNIYGKTCGSMSNQNEYSKFIYYIIKFISKLAVSAFFLAFNSILLFWLIVCCFFVDFKINKNNSLPDKSIKCDKKCH
jgi:hypothetical protein